MTEYGIWTESDGGFTETQMYSREEAAGRLAEIIRGSEDPETDRDDLQIREVCPDHEGQPKDGCEDCYAEYDEDESDEIDEIDDES